MTRSGRPCWGKPGVWGSFIPVLYWEVCMPNWGLADSGDWLDYKEATTVSCWCLTCKSCRSKHTLCRARRHRAEPHWDAYIASTNTWKSTMWGFTVQQSFLCCAHYVNLIVECYGLWIPVFRNKMSRRQQWRQRPEQDHRYTLKLSMPSKGKPIFPKKSSFSLTSLTKWDRILLNSPQAVRRN